VIPSHREGYGIVTTTEEAIGQHIRDGIKAEMVPLFDELRRFTDRRIAELSAEVHATVQLVDFSETNLTGQLTKIHDQVAAMIAVPAVSTRNSGLELEAVVQATEAAANQIMGAAEAIGDWLRDGKRDAEALESVAEKLNAIFEACSFQDVTGQRLRRAIQHLQQVETVLTGMMPGTVRQEPISLALPELLANGPDLAQDAIDQVFGTAGNSPPLDTELGQDDVDSMFGPASTPAPPVPASDLGQDVVDRMFG
jgi:chemotaxis protein CheZ